MEERLWGSLIIFSHGTSIARGVAVLVKNNLDIVIHQELSDSKGRLLALNVKIKDKIYRLLNVYGPNKDAEAVCNIIRICHQLYDRWS